VKPNILLFLADDMGWGDSRLNNPNSKIKMPHLEQLAAQN
jgi:arylsulfatase A-like enzyme